MEVLHEAEGNDTVIIYLEKERAKKVLPANWRVSARGPVPDRLYELLGEKNVKAVEKGLKR